MPVLIIQGSNDRVVKSNAVVQLLSSLKSQDQTVRWFSNRGHLLLETDFVQPDTMLIVTGWLREHATESIPAQIAHVNKDKAKDQPITKSMSDTPQSRMVSEELFELDAEPAEVASK